MKRENYRIFVDCVPGMVKSHMASRSRGVPVIFSTEDEKTSRLKSGLEIRVKCSRATL